jgi:hypothetical protein
MFENQKFSFKKLETSRIFFLLCSHFNFIFFSSKKFQKFFKKSSKIFLFSRKNFSQIKIFFEIFKIFSFAFL